MANEDNIKFCIHCWCCDDGFEIIYSKYSDKSGKENKLDYNL